jgi:hypothetical protein
MAGHDDPAEWTEEEIVGRALFELFQKQPSFGFEIGILDIVGEFIDERNDGARVPSIMLATFDRKTAELFRDGSPLNRLLSQLIEKPVVVTFTNQ